MKRKALAAILLSTLIISACSSTEEQVSEPIAPKDSQNIKELVHDYSADNIESQNASITSQQLIVTENDGNEVVYDVSEEEFFVSIAPYVNETHP